MADYTLTKTGAQIDAIHSKVDAIEAGADVTDATNVAAAGALMDNEVTSLSGIKTLTVPDNTTISSFVTTLLDDTSSTVARATLGVDAAGTDNSTDVTLAGTPDYLTITGQEITRGLIDLTTDVTGVLPVANYATGTPDGTKFVRDDGTLQAIPSSSSPLTTKGDIYTYSTTDARLPVGTNGQVLSADSTEATGLKWIAAGGTGTVTSVDAGNGLDFTSITTTGSVTLGTPGTLTSATTNAVTTTSHTHDITTGIADTNIVRVDSASAADDEYARFTANGLESRSASEVLSDIGAITASSSDTLTNKTFDANGTGNSLSNVETADIAAGSKSGSDTTLITGTAGTASDLAIWNADGDLVDGPTPPTGTILGTTDTQTLTNKTMTSNGNQFEVFTESHATSHTLSASECYGAEYYVTGAATLTLPAVASGMSIAVHTIGDVAVSIDPNASDKIILDGTALDDGDKITNLSTAGDVAVLTYYSADGWHATTNGWTDGGA